MFLAFLFTFSFMTLLFISFFAGVLTVLAPCILPLLPIVIGRSSQTQNKLRPLIISGSLAVAIVVFTLLLKASTAFINIPPHAWSIISGVIIIIFGLISLFPTLWEKVSIRLGFSQGSNTMLAQSAKRKDTLGDIFIGLSLGPVFSSCSPTYFLILATVLPQSYAKGVVYLIAYAIGLSSVLLLIGYLGQKVTKRLTGLADAHGLFKRGLGLLFILVGIFILTGYDKKFQSYILEHSSFNITTIEQKLLLDPMGQDGLQKESSATYPMYQEIVNPSDFVNTDGITLSSLVGQKVILLDFLTYSCINCQRTFPYLNAWYDAYKDDGLEIVGIHTPEFAFEKNKQNVIEAAKEFGLEFPIVMDNDYATWNAYKNRYWPRKYLIDIHGNIVYDHIGEGAYDETEKKIQELLEERRRVLGETGTVSVRTTPIDAEEVSFDTVKSRETYFGSLRNNKQGMQTATLPDGTIRFARPTASDMVDGQLYLIGDWKITPEYAENSTKKASILFRYTAQKVFIVMDADDATKATILIDGKKVNASTQGVHVNNGVVTIDNEQLYRLIEHKDIETHTLEIQIENAGVRAYAFTFG
jgi:cytochrome c biogenesis protein CcdA/thiol-disulfide isomerase/thioredoxin